MKTIYLVIQSNRYESVFNPVFASFDNDQDAQSVCDSYNNMEEYYSYDYTFYIQKIEH